MAHPPLTPSEEYTIFYKYIGIAITQWAHVENALFNIAAECFKPASSKIMGASFHAIENFRSKLEFVNKSVTHSNAFKSHQIEWSNLHEHVRSLSIQRNKIAHGRVIVYPSSSEGRRYAIVPISYRESGRKSTKSLPPSGSLCMKDICISSRNFGRASENLFRLLRRVQGITDPVLTEPMPELPAPTVHTLARQLRSMLPRPVGSSKP